MGAGFLRPLAEDPKPVLVCLFYGDRYSAFRRTFPSPISAHDPACFHAMKAVQLHHMEVEPTVIFDLDGTLLDGDSTSCWMLHRIRSSWWRITLACCLIPIGVSLMLVSRRLASSVALWVASFGMDKESLHRSFRSSPLVAGSPDWRLKGIEVLQSHVSRGDRVVIATAAPRWLAEAFFERLGLALPIIGSELAPFWGGWMGVRHCRNEEKCDALADAGYGQDWAVAYSDSTDDWPLLKRADRAFIVNCSPKTVARLKKRGITAHRVEWR